MLFKILKSCTATSENNIVSTTYIFSCRSLLIKTANLWVKKMKCQVLVHIIRIRKTKTLVKGGRYILKKGYLCVEKTNKYILVQVCPVVYYFPSL